MDGQYYFSRIKLNPHFLRRKVCAHQSITDQVPGGPPVSPLDPHLYFLYIKISIHVYV